VGRVADGVASRMVRLKAIGNGQVPIVAATAFLQLQQILKENKQ
jgi:DNA (cytosine-5)-methyltransferase 1